MSLDKFDYIIIGAGASGLQLALAMLRDEFFKTKSIGIIEKKNNFNNDKTWCFWESGNGLYDDIIYKSWKSGYVKACGEKINFDLQDISYKMIKSIDFYNYAKEKLEQSNQIHWIEDKIIDLSTVEDKTEVKCEKNSYLTEHVFDSRLPNNYKPKDSINILQHFKGWFIETENDVFNPEEFCMMDYTYSENQKTNFIYVLPFSKNKALIESTYFSPNLASDKTYEDNIKTFLKNKLDIKTFNIYETEKGVIPMTSYPFHKNHKFNITKIGTSGGWVKSSTGYSFKNSERLALKIIENIKRENSPHQDLFHRRFKHYDKIFLDVLYKQNHYGEKLFYKMYKRNKIKDILEFLDEQTHFSQELKIMFSMTSFYFIKAFLKHSLEGFKIK